jgi:hypothetical protein
MRGSLESFYYYSSGIFDDSNCDEKLDHAVCLVGKTQKIQNQIPIFFFKKVFIFDEFHFILLLPNEYDPVKTFNLFNFRLWN